MGFAGPFRHNRMRAVIFTKRMVYDYMELDRWEGDNAPTWLYSKLYAVLTARMGKHTY
jgi:hypothetical protein